MRVNPGFEVHICSLTRIAARFHRPAGTDDLRLDKLLWATGAAGEENQLLHAHVSACRLPNDAGLLFKVLGRETAPVKAKVEEFWGVAREEIAGAFLPAPLRWR